METDTHTETLPAVESPSSEITPGAEVVYGLHGRCRLISIETKKIKDRDVSFYRLEICHPPLARTTRPAPTIWLPTASAKEQGLRMPLRSEEVDSLFAILSSREYYFPLEESWVSVFQKLETTLRKEGATGLAKVESYLFVLKQRLLVPPSEVLRFAETIHRLFTRELSAALNEPLKPLEEKLQKALRQKLLPDH